MTQTDPDTDPAPWPPKVRRLRIGDIGIDLSRRRVQRPDGEDELPQRMFDLLLLFTAEPHRLHARGELLRRVWDGVIVEDANLSQSVWMLRKALGEDRKHWIRTVSKKGYVFEPNAEIEALGAEALDTATTSGNPHTTASSSKTNVAHPSSTRGYFPRSPIARIAIAAMLIVGLGATIAIAMRMQSPARAVAQGQAAARPAASASVTLIEVEDPGVAAQARLPALLLSAWLEWKLSALPQMTVLTPAQLASDAPAQAGNTVVLLSSGPSPDAPSDIQMLARFDDASGKQQQLRVAGPPQQLASLVDTLSARVLAQLAPQHAGALWPQLKVDTAAAAQFVEMMQARRAHDWRRAADIGAALTARAPDFALAHLHLAHTYGALLQVPAAQRHLQIARTLLRPMPADAAAVIDAYLLALSPQHTAAAEAYGALAQRYPDKPAFLLNQARALARAGRFADARTLLSDPRWKHPHPVKLRVDRLLAKSHIELSLGDHPSALSSAREADRLVEAAGKGWEHDRGKTLLMLAEADIYAAQAARGSPYFEAAARQFELAGDEFSALRARFLGETTGPYQGSSQYLDAWLTQARAAGQDQLELSALRAKASQLYRTGDITAYRERLAQAIAVAATSGDQWSQAAMQVDLLNEDLLRGDFSRIDQRLKDLRKKDMQGELALWAEQFTAIVALNRGDFPASLNAVERGEAQARTGRDPGAPDAGIAGMFACMRAAILMLRGNPTAARNQYERCGKTGPIERLQAQIGMAEVDLLSGDRAAALHALRKATASLPDVAVAPGRWSLAIDVAALLLQAGDTAAATELYNQVLPSIEASDYSLLESHARMGLAEIAAAHGNASTAREQLRMARAAMPAGHWLLSQRADLLDIALATLDDKPAHAHRLLIELDRQAHRHGDVTAQLRVHSLMPADVAGVECTQSQRAALIAKSGLRGADAGYLRSRQMGAAVAEAQSPSR